MDEVPILTPAPPAPAPPAKVVVASPDGEGAASAGAREGDAVAPPAVEMNVAPSIEESAAPPEA